MTNLHNEKILIDDTNVDHEMKVPITEIMRLLQVSTFNHSNIIGLDHKTMEEKSQAFWVVTKMKVKLLNDIKSGENVKVSTWTQPLSTIRAIRDFKIKSKNCVKAKATAEWCCLDINTRKIRKLSSIVYPELDMVENSVSGLTFTNPREELTEKNYVHTREVRATDIDINNHTNNLKYNFMAIDALTWDELTQNNIKEYEIYFVNESKLGDKIKIYKKKIKSCFYIEGRIEDKTIFKSLIKVKKREA